jgi:hypothetical protein
MFRADLATPPGKSPGCKVQRDAMTDRMERVLEQGALTEAERSLLGLLG